MSNQNDTAYEQKMYARNKLAEELLKLVEFLQDPKCEVQDLEFQALPLNSSNPLLSLSFAKRLTQPFYAETDVAIHIVMGRKNG